MLEHQETEVPDLDTETIIRVLGDAPVSLAVLYGSYVHGDSTAASDVDLAVAFEASLSSGERTDARLSLIERLSRSLAIDDVDIVPLSNAPATLIEEIVADGVLLYGSRTDIEPYLRDKRSETSHEERLAAFDSLLAELDDVV